MPVKIPARAIFGKVKPPNPLTATNGRVGGINGMLGGIMAVSGEKKATLDKADDTLWSIGCVVAVLSGSLQIASVDPSGISFSESIFLVTIFTPLPLGFAFSLFAICLFAWWLGRMSGENNGW